MFAGRSLPSIFLGEVGMYWYNGFREDGEAVEPCGWWVSVLVGREVEGRMRARGLTQKERQSEEALEGGG